MQIDVCFELTRAGMQPEGRSPGFRVACPFHEDGTPSMQVYADNGNYKCFACHATGDLVSLLSRVEGKQRHVIESGLRERYGGEERPIAVSVIETWHQKIWTVNSLLESLRKRGVSNETIRQYRLGADNERITIPVLSPGGIYVNVRKYLPDREPNDKRAKVINTRGRGKRLRLFPYSQIHYDKIVLCGGEIKALAVAQRLNKHNIGAIATTGGEGDWAPALEGFFTGKQVYVCNDIDAPGHAATAMRCRRLRRVTSSVYALELPLDPIKFPTGDLNDFIALDFESATDRLMHLLENARPYDDDTITTDVVEEAQDEIFEADISVVADASIVNKRIRCNVSVSAIDETAYYLPKLVKVTCSQDQEACIGCPVFKTGCDVLPIDSTSASLLAMMNTRQSQLREETREALGIPPCSVCKFTPLESCKAVETRAQRPLGLTDHNSSRLNIPAVFIDFDAELNDIYKVEARVLPHPKTQASTMLVSTANAIADALDTFVIEDDFMLQNMRPKENTLDGIRAHLQSHYAFLSSNVTRIYGRERLHAFVDLVFHSVLSIKPSAMDKPIKGWLELLVVGDSAQGKTEVTKGLSEWYQLGSRVDCKNATVAGLIGGLEQMNGRWFSQWGVLPTQDRRLVILEEIKGMRPEILAKLTDTRSSGVAQIPKIRRASAPARTRLLAVSNPARTRVVMSNYAFGCQAIAELVPNPEDIRRFDAALILNKDDIDVSVLNQQVQLVQPLYTDDDARKLILWAWTRKLEDVIITPEAWAKCVATANELCEVYTDALPLLDRGDTRNKLLRWATACAARCYSTDDGQRLIVLPQHVEYITELLNAEYKAPTHGYYDYSRTLIKRAYTADVEEIHAALRQLTLTQRSLDLLMRMQDFEVPDIMDIGGVTRDEAQLIMSRLVRAGAFVKEEKFYVKTAGFIQLLRTYKPMEHSNAENSYSSGCAVSRR